MLTPKKLIFTVAAAMSATCITANAQEPDTALIHSTIKKYNDESSVYTNYTQKLVISLEGGQLKANSYINTERILITDLSLKTARFDNTIDNDFTSQIFQGNTIAYIPQKNGAYKRVAKYNSVSGYTGQDGLEDDDNQPTPFTGLCKGTVIQINASQSHPMLGFLPIHMPYQSYPVLHSEFVVIAPKYVELKFVPKGAMSNIFHHTQKDSAGNVVHRFTANHLNKLNAPSDVPSAFYYSPYIVTMVSKYRLPGTSKDSAISENSESLFKYKRKFIYNLNVKSDTMLERLVAEITKGDKTDRQKAKHIYEWLQNTIHYKAINIGLGGWVPREADTVCKRQFGDCKDMSSLYMKMGRIAGLKTYLSWIGTTLLPFTFEETPVPYVSNHMICALNIDNEWIFVDGTHSNLPFGGNRDDIQGKETMIALDNEHFKIETIPVVNADKNVTIDSTSLKISTENFEDVMGKTRQRFVGYPAWNSAFALSYLNADADRNKKFAQTLAGRGGENYVLESFSFKQVENENRDVTLGTSFIIPRYITKNGADLMLNMNLLKTMKSFDIDTVNRRVDFYHDYKETKKEVTILEIPVGYKIKYLPKSVKGNFKDYWSYSITYKVAGNKVILTKEYKINTVKLPMAEFAANNTEIKSLITEYKDNLVLTASKK